MNGGLANEVRCWAPWSPAWARTAWLLAPMWPLACRRRIWRRWRLAGASGIAVGAQDALAHAQGAFTGEVSAAMLRGWRALRAAGHSERRQYHGETDAVVADKAKAALSAGITPIVCVGDVGATRSRAD